MAEEPELPTRSADFGVGKRIGGSVYVHRSYEGRRLRAWLRLTDGGRIRCDGSNGFLLAPASLLRGE